MRGSAKCSEPAMLIARAGLPGKISKLRPWRAGRSSTMRPPCHAKPGESMHVGRARARATAGRVRARARVEVADLHARRRLARVAQGERAREVAGHPVVAEGRHQPTAGGLRARPEALEDLADEAALAGRVEVVRARRDRRLHGGLAPARERPDGRDQHVAALHERAHRVGPLDVGERPLEARRARRPARGRGPRCAPRAPGAHHGRRAPGTTRSPV